MLDDFYLHIKLIDALLWSYFTLTTTRLAFELPSAAFFSKTLIGQYHSIQHTELQGELVLLTGRGSTSGGRPTEGSEDGLVEGGIARAAS